MSPRRSLKLPITLAVTMIILLVILAAGWVLLAVHGAFADTRFASWSWVVLATGSVFMALLVAGVVVYLALSVKAINLNRRQTNFIDSVTHELKSPIASLKLYLQTMTRRRVDLERQADFYRSMLQDLDRLDHLVNQMLDAGRLETRRRGDAAEEDDVRVDEVLRECAGTVCLRYRLPRSTIRLELDGVVVRGRRSDLELIFRNILDNAVKYGGSPPEVEVSSLLDAAARPRRRVLVRVADNGPGIPHPWRHRVFGRFVRLGSELERETPGTGLGLYIVQTLVRRLGGRVTNRDREGRSGTVFEVRLPEAVPEGGSS